MSEMELRYRVQRLEEMLNFTVSVLKWRTTDPLLAERSVALARRIQERLEESPDYVPVKHWRDGMTD